MYPVRIFCVSSIQTNKPPILVRIGRGQRFGHQCQNSDPRYRGLVGRRLYTQIYNIICVETIINRGRRTCRLKWTVAQRGLCFLPGGEGMDQTDFSNLFHAGFLEGDLLKSTWVWLREQTPYIHRYNEAWRVPVKSRPSIFWGLKNSDGYWPLYKWGQIQEDFGRIDDMPPQMQLLARMIEERFGHPRGYLNSALATFYGNGTDNYIAAHHDKGVWSDQTPIYNISFGAVRPFLICDLKSLGQKERRKLNVLQEFPMHPGDLMVLPHEVNTKYSHCIPRDPKVTDLRISIGFRRLTKHWIRESEGGYEYYTTHGATKMTSVIGDTKRAYGDSVGMRSVRHKPDGGER